MLRWFLLLAFPVFCLAICSNISGGMVVLNNDVLCQECPQLEQNHTVLDLNGYTLTCSSILRLTGDFNVVRNGRVEARDVHMLGSHSVVSGIEFHDRGGLVVDGVNNTVSEIQIKQGLVVRGKDHIIREISVHDADYGVHVLGGENISIVESNFRLLRDSGIVLQDTIGIRVQGVSISLSAGGVQLVNGSGNVVIDSYVDSRGVIPIELKGDGYQHQVSRNTIAGKAPFAVLVDGPENCTITDNAITKHFRPWNPAMVLFYENHRQSCDESTNVWIDNKGGIVGCGVEDDAALEPIRYGALIFNFFSPVQYSFLTSTVFISSSLSVFGSGTIIYLILCRNRRDVALFHRILLGLCVADFVSSISVFLQPILLPTGTMMPLAVGNMASCRFVGFGVYFFLASTIYFCELALYFSLTVRHGWSERKATQKLEPWVHILPWATVFVHNVVGLAFNVIQPSSALGLCLIGCEQEFGLDRCVQGANPAIARFMQIPAGVIPPICAVLGTFWTIGVYSSVRRSEMRSSRYDFESSTRDNTTSSEHRVGTKSTMPIEGMQRDYREGSPSILNATSRRLSLPIAMVSDSLSISRHQRKKSKAVADQALRYCGSYLNHSLVF